MVLRLPRGSEAAVNAAQRQAIRLVAAMLGFRGRAGGKRLELRSYPDQADGLREFHSKLDDLRQVVIQSNGRLPRQRIPGYVMSHVGIAVAVAADPATQPKERGNPEAAFGPARDQQILDVGVKSGQLV